MKVEITRKTQELKVVGFVSQFGDLILRNRGDTKNTVVTDEGRCYQGVLDFDVYLKTLDKKDYIYEGDSITIQF